MTNIYSANWILPISSTPIKDGAVAFQDELIVGVGTRTEIVERFPEAKVEDFGEAAILPGLINSHSHLELTVMRGFLDNEEHDFTQWLRKLTRARLDLMTPDDLYVSALWGACEAVRAGVTCFGDASDSAHESMSALREIGLRGTVFQESFGPDPKFLEENIGLLTDKLARLRQLETPLLRAGVSPHAPYTVCSQQLQLISEIAIAEKLPLMMHAAESVAESSFVRDGSGVFAEGLHGRGIDWQGKGVSPIQYLGAQGILNTRPLLAHCVQLDDADLEAIRSTDSRVAPCPTSNAKLGHGRAPLVKFLERGIVVGLGSDSVASNNTCDLLDEARFAALLAKLDIGVNSDRTIKARDVLNLATMGGARALNLEDQVGELRAGLQADLAIVAMTNNYQLPSYDPESTLVFASSGRNVITTVVAGKVVFRDGHVSTVDESSLNRKIRSIAAKLGAR